MLRQEKYLRHSLFPKALKTKLRKKHHNLTDIQVDLVFQGLYSYFRMSQLANGTMLAMPSQIVDEVWHDFILFTRLYQLFCQKALGRFLHHTPTEAMNSPTQATEGIKRAWRLSCYLEGIDPRNPEKLPLLFGIDGLLNIENGFKYNLDCLAKNEGGYCAGDIGCSSGCSGDSGGCSSDSSGDSSDSGGGSDCGGGCGGD